MKLKRDHFVPQVYLKNFLRPVLSRRNPVLWIYPKSHPECYASSTRDTAHRIGFYGPNVDSYLRVVESAIGPILGRWQLSGAIPTAHEKEIMARYVATQFVRTPKWAGVMQLEGRAGMIALIERRAEMAGLDLREYLSMSMNTSDEREIQLVLGQMKNPDAHGGIPVHESHAQILGFIGVENRALELLKMNWTILECHHSRFFITGDTPAIGFRLLPDGRPELGFCPNMQDFQMSLPISPQQCLVIHHARVPDGRLWVGRRMIDELNRRMAFSCDKIIISPHRNDHVSSLVREMSLPESQPKFDHNEAKEVWRRIFLGTAGEEKQPT